MNPSGLMIRSGKMRIILVLGLMMASFLLLFLTHQTLKLRGVEKESHICMHQKDSLVAQLQVCVEYGKRMDSTLSQEKTLKDQCQSSLTSQKADLIKNHKEELEKQAELYKKLAEEFDLFKKEKKINEEELTKQLEILTHSKQEVKNLQDQIQNLLKEKEVIRQSFMDQSWKYEKTVDHLDQCTTKLKQLLSLNITQNETQVAPLVSTTTEAAKPSQQPSQPPVQQSQAEEATSEKQLVSPSDSPQQKQNELKPTNETALANTSVPVPSPLAATEVIRVEQSPINITEIGLATSQPSEQPGAVVVDPNNQNLSQPDVSQVPPGATQDLMDPLTQDGTYMDAGEQNDDPLNGEDSPKVRHQNENQAAESLE